jgi:predicted Zn-dependent peptidase
MGARLCAGAATYATLFPAGHPYHAFFATEKSIQELTLGDARSFFAQYYRPDRTRLVLVGDFELGATRALIERHFGALAPGFGAAPPPPVSECRWAKTSLAPAHRRIVLRSRSRNQRLELYWPARVGEEEDVLRGVFNLLKGELSAAASQTGLSHQVDGYLDASELSSYWVIGIDVAPGQPFEKVEPLLQRTITSLRSTFSDRNDLAAQRQALELADLLWQTRSLARARYLARRECQPAACLDAAQLLTPSAVNQLDRFALEKALVVERRFDISASLDGDLEVLP